MIKIPFTKMHWLWNDFIILDKTNNKLKELQITPKLVQTLSDRHFGIGFDQMLIVENSQKVDFKYRIYNCDWSEVEMCGNGVRCFLKYIIEKWLTDKTEVDVETLAWIIKPKLANWLVEVNMWKPILDYTKIPVSGNDETVISHDENLKFTGVSMWNPHCVIILKDEDLDNFDVMKYWKPIENNTKLFPNRINVEFIKIVSSTEIKMRVWERWTWETLACGTWACASVVAWIKNWFLDKNTPIKVILRWWELLVNWSWDKNDPVIMKWPAEIVFEGQINI